MGCQCDVSEVTAAVHPVKSCRVFMLVTTFEEISKLKIFFDSFYFFCQINRVVTISIETMSSRVHNSLAPWSFIGIGTVEMQDNGQNGLGKI